MSVLMFLVARHLFSREKRVSSNMKAYVVVRGPVANIRNIVAMRSDQKLFALTVANDLVRSD